MRLDVDNLEWETLKNCLEDYKFYLYIPIEQLSSSSEQWFWIMLDFHDDDPKPLNLTSDWGSICH
jgi:hypothetical protein